MGMKQLRKLTGISGITIYRARHTFATIARKDWGIVDEVQLKVVTALRKLDKKSTVKLKEPISKAA
jgi:hypothetical protein